MNDIPNKAHFYVAEAAKILRMHRVTLYRKIDSGDIEVEYFSERITVIPRESLIAYLEKVKKTRQNAHSVA